MTLRSDINRLSTRLIAADIPSKAKTLSWAALYVVSGICQPMLMTLCQAAGLANKEAQLYMFFYYLGPSLLLLTLKHPQDIPPRPVLVQACGIAALDIVAQTLNYTGNALAGPTVFAIIYSSVTIWTAVFSRILLHRSLSHLQWMAVWVVFGGLCLTATNSLQLGANVAQGTALVFLGSTLHGSAYVFSEAILTVPSSSSPFGKSGGGAGGAGGGTTTTTKNNANESETQNNCPTDTSQLIQQQNDQEQEHLLTEQEEQQIRALLQQEPLVHPPLNPRQNAAIQGTVACFLLGIWQFWYTVPHWQEALGEPLEQAGTSFWHASLLLACFALANLIHSVTFSHTLKYYPGGATSAGVMKGLQAVLVFVAAHVFYCGRLGGAEMCFTPIKLISLVTVTGGVLWFGILTEQLHNSSTTSGAGGSGAGAGTRRRSRKQGYTSIDDTTGEGQELVVHV